EEFRAAKGLKARFTVASELLKNAADLADRQGAASEHISTLNGEIVNHQRTQPAVALEAVFVRDDIREMAGAAPVEGEVTAKAIWGQDMKIGVIMEQVPAAKHRRAVESFK